jgi:tRNA dimethylallyltransferase
MSNKGDKFKKTKVLVILGPTASGKTSLGVRLARKYNGEIISADSRQVYRGMDIGSGKDLAEYLVDGQAIPYHLIDVVDPQTEFNLADYQKLAFVAIEDISKRGCLPIIVGGSGLYLQAVVDNYNLSAIKPDVKKRSLLDSLSREQLFARLEKLKPEFAGQLNNSDKNNPRRLVRYLEILETDESAPPKIESPYDFLLLGLDWPDDILRERIKQRIITRLENEDMIGEVSRLQTDGLSWQRLCSFGLEYKFISYYLLDKLSYEEMIEKLSIASYRFAKHQKTWFRRWEKQGRKIEWVKDKIEAENLINQYFGSSE